MLDSFTYVNSDGEIIEFGKGNILIDSNSLRDYEWAYNSYYRKASGFKKNMRKVPLVVLIYGDNANAVADNLYEVLEKDVLTNQRGKIIINGYYTYGFVQSSQKKSYLKDGILKLSLTMVIDSPNWIKETFFSFRPTETEEGEWLTYTHGFPYTFKRVRRGVDTLYNDSFIEQNVKIKIYGQCVNPTVLIAGHPYQLNTTLTADEYAVIDTSEKTIYKYSVNGAKTNIFNTRSLQSYVFEKIPTGIQTIQTMPSNVNVDIMILEERGEPKWAILEEDKETQE